MDQNKALSIIEQHKKENALIYINPEDLQTQKLFIPQVTVLHALPQDFHSIDGKKMPKSHHTYRIGEAAGVSFVPEHCSVERLDDHTWVGRSQGKRRQPDGTWKTSNVCEYEFDAELRAQIDAKEKAGPKYEKKLLELRKFGRQRAETGAKSRVIRELVGIPTSFDNQDISRAMVVCRIAVNTDPLLDDPATAQAAIEVAMTGKTTVYGPSEPIDVTPEPEALPAPDDSADDFDTFDTEEIVSDQLDATKEKRIALEEWLLHDRIARSAKATKGVHDVLGNADATIEDIDEMIDRCKKYVARGDA